VYGFPGSVGYRLLLSISLYFQRVISIYSSSISLPWCYWFYCNHLPAVDDSGISSDTEVSFATSTDVPPGAIGVDIFPEAAV
jgi:hypothetical protein